MKIPIEDLTDVTDEEDVQKLLKRAKNTTLNSTFWRSDPIHSWLLRLNGQTGQHCRLFRNICEYSSVI